MKRIFAIVFAIYFLLGGFLPKMDFSQLLYLVEAIEHFKCHQEELAREGKNFSLADFFSMHFINPDSHSHEENHGHEELPLQQFSNGLQFLLVSLGTNAIEDSRAAVLLDIEFAPSFYHCEFSNTIEHPPSIG